MADDGREPFLSAAASREHPVARPEESSESTPLLTGSTATPQYDSANDTREGDAASIASRASGASSIKSNKKAPSRWPSIVAMIILIILAITVMVFAFFVPAAVEEYAKQAIVIEPTNLSLESITTDGVRARIQANFRLDGQRVQNDHVRRVGLAATWAVGKLGTEETSVSVYLPEYDSILLGTATVPPLTVSIVDGHITAVDFVAHLVPGDAEGIRMIANEWLEGRLGTLRVRGKADVQIRAGIIPLGTHAVSESLTFEADKLPQVPAYNITRLDFEELPIPGSDQQALAAQVSITAYNQFPVSLDVPELGFDVLLPGCDTTDPSIFVATATTSRVAVRPHSNVVVDARGLIKDLPEALTQLCPGSNSSVLDHLFERYLDGEEATVLVRGQKHPAGDTPGWLSEILSSITVPVPFPGRSFDNLIRNFSLTDTHFDLPDPFAEPGDPDADPKVSGTILVVAGLPSQMNFSLNVTGVRAKADAYYKGRELGKLNVSEYQPANSTQHAAKGDEEAYLEIQSRLNEVPLRVTDADVLTDVIQTLLFGGKNVVLTIDALVDVRVHTILGELEIKNVPAEGKIPVKPIGKDLLGPTGLQVGHVEITGTTPNTIDLRALVNITNPTPYTANIPYISIHVLSNGTAVGEAVARNLVIKRGNNTNLAVSATWDPLMGGGEHGLNSGRDLLSQYISGFNTSVTVRTHAGSIPALPAVGEALSRLNLTIQAPKLRLPGSNPDEKGHFIRDATFHILSSTATFTLVSPLNHNTLFIDWVNATALYNGTEEVGRIEYDLPFAAPPGVSVTPKLPVEWSTDSVGYGKLKEALGGTLKLDAKARVGIRVGAWKNWVWYVGKGIGAGVRL